MVRDELFCIPNTLFGVFDEPIMPIVFQVSLDGSYGPPTQSPPRIMAYAGVAGYEVAWKVLMPTWDALLTKFQIKWFRSTELRVHPKRQDIFEAFGEVIIRSGLQAVGNSAPETLLSDSSDAAKKRDLFEKVVKQLFAVVPEQAHLAIVCDREQDLAKEVAAWIDRLRWLDRQDDKESIYDRIAGICYMNSRVSIQTQAADLTACLFRENGERLLRDPNAPIDSLLNRLTGGRLTHSFISKSEFLS